MKIIITGSSQGFGRCIAKQASLLYPHCDLLLIARNLSNLVILRDELIDGNHKGSVNIYPVDINNILDHSYIEEEFKQLMIKFLRTSTTSAKTEKVYFISNASQLGALGNTDEIEVNDFADILKTNVLSVIKMLKIFVSMKDIIPKILDLNIINVSSLLATQPEQYMSPYCVSKCAIEMYLKCLSLSIKEMNILNYACGALRTAMRDQLEKFNDCYKNATLVDSDLSAITLLKLMLKKHNGDHIDYYDTISPSDLCREEIPKHVSFNRIETFCASHRLVNKDLSEEENKSIFGKCYGLHGHNYKLIVCVGGEIDKKTGMIINLMDLKLILNEILLQIDHKDLNETELFKGVLTTVENITEVLFNVINKKLTEMSGIFLKQLTVYETDKNFCIRHSQ